MSDTPLSPAGVISNITDTGAAGRITPKLVREAFEGSVSLVPLQAFGFSSSATAAANTTAVTSALASGEALCILPESSFFQIESPIVLTGNMTLIGLNQAGCTITPPPNTNGIQVYNQRNWLEGITISYASQEPVTNTGSVGLLLGSTSVWVSLSRIAQITVYQSQTGIAYGSGAGDFQNTIDGIDILHFSSWGAYLQATGGASGSSYSNWRIENTAPANGTSDCVGGLHIKNMDDFTFNCVNLEKLGASAHHLDIEDQASGIINGLHFEGMNPTFAGQSLIYFNFQNNVQIMNFSITNSDLSGGCQLITVNDTGRITLNGFLEYGNTFTATLPTLAGVSANSKMVVDGISPRNSGSIVIPSRQGIFRVEDTMFDVVGGRVMSGLVGTAAPSSGGMPAPWRTTANAALPWVVGDRMNNTAVTSTTTPGWRCTTAGSPGTWTAEPVL